MSEIQAVQPVSQPDSAGAALFQTAAPARADASFGDLLIQGVEAVNGKIVEADKLAQAFAVDDSIPVHQVTFALEQARISLELMMQIRGRMIEAYQQFMNMQL